MQLPQGLAINGDAMADDKKAKKDVKDAKDEKDAAGAEAAADGAAPEDAAEKPKFTPKKIILFIVLPLLLLGGGGAAAYFLGFLDKFLPGHTVDCTKLEEGAEVPPECAAAVQQAEAGTPGAFIDIPPMIVNLSGSSKQPRFLKVTLKIELEKKEDEKIFTELLPRVVDQFQTYLRELRIDDLRGSSGMYRMKIEMLSRVRAAAPNIGVRDVLFQEILVQ